jgi:lipopolysaccharide export system permease protein
MRIIDRYVLSLFIKVTIVCFLSLAGLYVVIDAFSNLDEFLTYGKQQGNTLLVLADYYLPRTVWFFDRTAGLLAMISSIFAITMLQRTNELTALMAAGVSKSRIIAPIVAATLVIAGIAAANREFYLPTVRDKLTRNAQDWTGTAARKVTPRYDLRSDILLSGKHTFANEKRVEEPVFRLPPELSTWGRQIIAENAFYKSAEGDRPAGYLLTNVRLPVNLAQLDSLVVEDRRTVFSPKDTPWLKPNECFVASVVSFEQLSIGGNWRQYLSTEELVTGIRGRVIEAGADVRVLLHARMVQPLLDITLVFLGLPLVLARGNRNIFVAAGIALGLVAGFYIVVLACHGLGSNYLLSPVLAAWLPLLIFGPLAFTLARPLWD